MNFTPNRQEQAAFLAGYRVTEDGKTVTTNGRTIALHFTKDGYLRFSLGPKLKRRHIRVHRLQAFQKYGEAMYAPGIVCRHLDGNPKNNHADNIAIGTQSDNMMDRPAEARHAHAFATSRHAMKHDHEAILAHYRQFGWLSTMAHFNVGKGTLSYIINKSQTGTPVTREERKQVRSNLPSKTD